MVVSTFQLKAERWVVPIPKQMISIDSGLPACSAKGKWAMNLVSGVKVVTPTPFTKRCLSSFVPAEITEAA